MVKLKIQEKKMSKNELIKTDGIWYKIKRFFTNIFRNKNKEKPYVHEVQSKEEMETFNESISMHKEIEKEVEKKKIAESLLNEKIEIYDLTDEEVDEMTEYFKEDINKIDQELIRIKQHILQMQKQLQQ